MEHNMHWSFIHYIVVGVGYDKIDFIITWPTFWVIYVFIFINVPFLSICLIGALEMK